MKLLVIEPGLKLWGSERAFLSSLPDLMATYDHLVIMTPPSAEIVGVLPTKGLTLETSDLASLNKRGWAARLKVILHILRICQKHKIEKIYLNQAGLCRIVHFIAKILKLPLVIHVRLVEDIPRCANLVATTNAPIDLIFVSKDMRERYPDTKAPEQHKRLFMAYDPYEFSHCVDCAIDRPKDVACIGRIAEMKGQRELIEAIAYNNNQNQTLMVLDIIGSALEDDPYNELVRSQVLTLQAQDIVHFLGYHPNATKYMKQYKLVIVPSYYETLGRVIYEAWEAGALPICSQDSGGAAEMMKASGGGILYEGHTPKNIAAALCKAAALSEQERCTLVEKGRNWAKSQLSLSTYRKALAATLFPLSK